MFQLQFQDLLRISLHDLGYAGQMLEGKLALFVWDRVHTVYGELLPRAYKQNSSRIVYQQYWKMSSPA
jgi:hypothetical protein